MFLACFALCTTGVDKEALIFERDGSVCVSSKVKYAFACLGNCFWVIYQSLLNQNGGDDLDGYFGQNMSVY